MISHTDLEKAAEFIHFSKFFLSGGNYGYVTGQLWEFGRNFSKVRKYTASQQEAMKSELPTVVNASLVIVLFSGFEENLTGGLRAFYKKSLSKEDKLRFKSLLHIRHSFAHNFSGKRARTGKKDFDKLMRSSFPLKGIEEFDNDYIRLNHEIVLETKNFFERTSNDFFTKLIKVKV